MSNRSALFIALIEATGDPMAPITINEAFQAAERLAKLMVPIADKEKAAGYVKQLLESFPDGDEMDKIAADPSFICALAGCFSNALVAYGRKHNPE